MTVLGTDQPTVLDKDNPGSGSGAGVAGTSTSKTSQTFAPLKAVVFRRFWLSSMASNFGAMIQTVAAAWMMTALTNDAQMVALVQTCATLPMMLISVPAGALADLYDRRTIMLVAQVAMLVVAACLAALTTASMVTPVVLLGATFLIGAGTALHGPSWQASMRDQVPAGLLEQAASLNSVGFNAARSLGPAFGGLIVALAGVASAFALNAISYLGIIATLLAWKRPKNERLLPPEGVSRAIATGVRFVALSPPLVAVLVRAGTFGLAGSSIWALTAVLARDQLGGGPATFGVLLGGFGIGAVIGAFARTTLPIGRDRLVKICSFIFAASAILLGLSHLIWLSVGLMALAGASWVMVLTGLSVSIQFIAPQWVMGRAIAVNQVSIFAGMALGSWIWGSVAQGWGIGSAFIASGCAMLSTLLLGLLFPLAPEESLDLTPTRDAPFDNLHGPVGPRDGPIIVTIEYRVAPRNYRAFLNVMRELSRIRRRNGALSWSLSQDLDDHDRWVERFQSLTWLDHLRRQTRQTRSDQAVRNRITSLQEAAPVVTRTLERRTAAERGESGVEMNI